MKKISLFLSLIFMFMQVFVQGNVVSATVENYEIVEGENQDITTDIIDNNEEIIHEESSQDTKNEEKTDSAELENENSSNDSIIDTNIDMEAENVGEVYDKFKKHSMMAYQLNDEHYQREEYAENMQALQEIEYLVNKTDANFEIALAESDGDFKYVESANTIDEAIDKLDEINNTYKSNEEVIPSIIDKNGVVVYATNAMGRVLKHLNGQPYYGSDINTTLYPYSDKSGSTNYINQGYVDDVPVIEDIGNMAKIQVAGYTGWINKDTTKSEYDMIIVPMNQVKHPSYYQSVNGELQHWISYDITGSNGERGYMKTVGVAPAFMKSGVRYYSYDNNYYYTSLDTLISDLKSGSNRNAVNSNSTYYSYYLYLPFRSKTVYSASDINRFIDANTDSDSKLRGTGEAFVNAQNKYGVNAATMLGIAINESAWGTSRLAKEKNNLFGLAAFDSNPNDANAYKSIQQCIDEFANYWISKGYSDPQDWRYYGGFLGGKRIGANVKYASDPFWAEKAASYSYLLDKQLSGNNISNLKDFNYNQLAIYTAATEVRQADRSVLYSVTSGLSNFATFVGVPIVLPSTNKYVENGSEWYAINPERTTPLSLQGGDEFIGTYDWNKKGYVKSNAIKLINSGTNNEGSNQAAEGVLYQTHVQERDWQEWKNNGQTSGTTGSKLRLEAIRMKLNDIQGASISYRTHVQDYGWQSWKKDGEISGTTGESKRLEAIQINANNLPAGYEIQYRVHVQDYGWMSWVKQGQTAGTTGQSKRIEAIEVKLVKSSVKDVTYSTHVQDYGWQSFKSNGQTAGTTGESKRLEAIKVSLPDALNVSLKYSTHVQDYGWLPYVKDGQVSGTVGERKRIEAIKVELVGAPEGTTIQYRVHVQDEGWQSWKYSGETAGTVGKSKRIEAIEIRLVSKY